MHQLTQGQIETLVQIARDESGDELSRPVFTETMLTLFDDIAGFETLPVSRRRMYLNLLWLRYQIGTGKK